MSMIQVDEVHVAPPGAITEHNGNGCWSTDCDYEAEPYFSSNLRMNLWSAPVLITDNLPGFEVDDDGALCLDADDVVWVSFCGGTDWDRKGGWTPNHPNNPEPGHYNGNGCTDRYPKVSCGLLEFDSED